MRIWSIPAAVLLVFAVTACGTASTDPENEASPSGAITSPTLILDSSSSLTEEKARGLRLESLQQRAIAYGISDYQPPNLVRWINIVDFPQVSAECLTSAGFPSRADDGVVRTPGIGPSQAKALQSPYPTVIVGIPFTRITASQHPPNAPVSCMTGWSTRLCHVWRAMDGHLPSIALDLHRHPARDTVVSMGPGAAGPNWPETRPGCSKGVGAAMSPKPCPQRLLRARPRAEKQQMNGGWGALCAKEIPYPVGLSDRSAATAAHIHAGRASHCPTPPATRCPRSPGGPPTGWRRPSQKHTR